jgi:hypothetical protein
MTIEKRTKILDITVPFSKKELPVGKVETTPKDLWTIHETRGVFPFEELAKLVIDNPGLGNEEIVIGGLTVESPDSLLFTRVNLGAPVTLNPPKRLEKEEINRAGIETVPGGFERKTTLVWKPTKRK